jgi:hypothetical protein
MSVVSCAVCGTSFPARSDAVYCSSACRQKAHRVRTAERLAELSDRVKHSVGSRLTKKEVAASRQHVENVMRRSRDLCLTAADRVQQAVATQERCRENGVVPGTSSGDCAAAPTIRPTERAPWRGN